MKLKNEDTELRNHADALRDDLALLESKILAGRKEFEDLQEEKERTYDEIQSIRQATHSSSEKAGGTPRKVQKKFADKAVLTDAVFDGGAGGDIRQVYIEPEVQLHQHGPLSMDDLSILVIFF